ncbi:MAG: hypothetical protein HGA36_01445 [Candidatus Moranbacteria bacterium]|nr:hypothetical protein [Candidatus Moranbacteria bacterium]
MFGIILISIGTFFEEISESISKIKINNGEASVLTMAFLSLFWGAIFYVLIGISKNDEFIFKIASLPTFTIRAFFEIIQAYVSVLAVVSADRTTYSFVRTITIPLLVIVDLILGYKMNILPITGIFIILISILVLFMNKKIGKKGIGLALFSAVNAVVTISLFKYDITHYNSVAAEQLFISLILLIFFAIFSIVRAKENPFIFLTKPVFFYQSFSVGIGGVIESFGYNYGAASIMTAAKRSSALFWSVLSGKVYFKEDNIKLKIIVMNLLVLGLVLLALN